MGKTKYDIQAETLMNVALYSPYWHILGGGEKYLLSIASALAGKHAVTLYAPAELPKQAMQRFGISIENVKIESEDSLLHTSSASRFLRLRTFDLFIAMTDGSVFASAAKKNFLIVQSPSHMPRTTTVNTLKLMNWHYICYSAFMQSIIRKRLGREASILSPAIDTEAYTSDPAKKEKMILTVGRFFPSPHSKKQNVLIDIFREQVKDILKGYTFVIAGALTEEGGSTVLEDLKRRAQGLPVKIYVDLPFAKLRDLYKQSSFYWHAAGIGEDLEKYPERAEHFGITILEAMAAGAIPLAYSAGGPQDIITGKSGILWKTKDELASSMKQLISDKEKQDTLRRGAAARAQQYAMASFYEKVHSIFIG